MHNADVFGTLFHNEHDAYEQAFALAESTGEIHYVVNVRSGWVVRSNTEVVSIGERGGWVDVSETVRPTGSL